MQEIDSTTGKEGGRDRLYMPLERRIFIMGFNTMERSGHKPIKPGINSFSVVPLHWSLLSHPNRDERVWWQCPSSANVIGRHRTTQARSEHIGLAIRPRRLREASVFLSLFPPSVSWRFGFIRKKSNSCIHSVSWHTPVRRLGRVECRTRPSSSRSHSETCPLPLPH